MALTAANLLAGGRYKAAYAPATGLFTAFDAILKTWYEGPTRDLINSTRVLARMMNRDVVGVTVSGSQITGNVRTRRNPGRMYSQEGAQLVTAGVQQTENVSWTTAFNYGRAQFTGQAISAARNDRGAFLAALDLEINGLAEDMQHGEQRVLYGDRTGRLARVVSVSFAGGTNTITLEHPGGIASQALGTQYLEEGMRVCFVDFTTETTLVFGQPTFRSDGTNESFEIDSVDYANGTIDIVAADLSGVLVAGDYMYMARDTDLTSMQAADCNRGIEMNGLASIINNADPPLQRSGSTGDPAPLNGFGNLASTEERWRAFVMDNGGVPVPFQPIMLQELMDGLDQNAGHAISSFLTTHGLRRQFSSELIAQKRYPDVMDLRGGFRALSWNGIPIFVDKDCTRGRWYGLNLDQMGIIKETDWEFVDKDGQVLRQVPNHDAYEVFMTRYAETVCLTRNRQAVIRDLEDS